MSEEIEELQREIASLRNELRNALDAEDRSYYFSKAPLESNPGEMGIGRISGDLYIHVLGNCIQKFIAIEFLVPCGIDLLNPLVE